MMGRMLTHAALFLGLTASTVLPANQAEDLRTLYDVETYRLDLAVDPSSRTLTGTVAIEAKVVGPALSRLVLDLKPPLVVQSVTQLGKTIEPQDPLAGSPLAFEHKAASLSILMEDGKKRGDVVRVAVTCSSTVSMGIVLRVRTCLC